MFGVEELFSPTNVKDSNTPPNLSQLPTSDKFTSTPSSKNGPPNDSDSNVSATHCEAPEIYPDETDVIIVGAGPAGLTLACELARRHINFLIFDINAVPVKRSRALLLHTRTLEILADLGISESALGEGHIVRGGRICLNNTTSFDIKFSGIDGNFPFSLVLEQSSTERLLVELLQELGHNVKRPVAVWKVEVPESKKTQSSDFYSDNKGLSSVNASILIAAQTAFSGGGLQSSVSGVSQSGLNNGCSPSTIMTSMNGKTPTTQFMQSGLLSIIQESDCVVHVKPLDFYGRPMQCPVNEIRCKYVVGCDGANSCVRKALEIPFKSKNAPSEFLVADTILQWGLEMEPNRMHMLQNSSGVMVCIPMTEGRWRIICSRACPVDVEDQVEPYAGLTAPDYAQLQQILDALVPGTLLQEIVWISAFALNCSIADCFKKSSGFLVGDAAHTHTPTFSLGMNSGIHDAYNLGWKLASAVKGANSQLLDTYNTERKQAAEDLVKMSMRMLDSVFNRGAAFRCVLSTLAPLLNGLEVVAHRFSCLMSQTDYVYNESLIVGKNCLSKQNAVPGSRISDVPIFALSLMHDEPRNVTDTPTSISRFIRGCHHTLFLCIHVLPPGTKVRTLFGCQRSEEATRWNSKCLDRLARLGRLLTEIFKGREAQVAYGGLKVVWILCGLVNLKSPTNNVGLGQIRDHVPYRLVHFFAYGARIGTRNLVAIDYEGEFHNQLALKLADPDGLYGNDYSGAFILVRPDGHIYCNGYVGDKSATGFALDYGLGILSD